MFSRYLVVQNRQVLISKRKSLPALTNNVRKSSIYAPFGTRVPHHHSVQSVPSHRRRLSLYICDLCVPIRDFYYLARYRQSVVRLKHHPVNMEHVRWEVWGVYIPCRVCTLLSKTYLADSVWNSIIIVYLVANQFHKIVHWLLYRLIHHVYCRWIWDETVTCWSSELCSPFLSLRDLLCFLGSKLFPN